VARARGTRGGAVWAARGDVRIKFIGYTEDGPRTFRLKWRLPSKRRQLAAVTVNWRLNSQNN